MAKGFQDLLGTLLASGLAKPEVLEGAAKQLGLDDLLGGLLGGQSKSGGGLAGMLGGLLGGGASSQASSQSGVNPLELISQLAGGKAAAAPAVDPEERAKTLLLAMILAAKADGKLGPEEYDRIVKKLDETDASPEVREFVYQAMAEANDPTPLIEAARKDPSLAKEIFAASVLAIRIDTPAESRYLMDLAKNLGLSEAEIRDVLARAGLA